MADPILEFDAAASNIDGTNPGTALVITTGNYGLTSFSYPAPPAKVQWASSVDTEGSKRVSSGHENRVITVSLEVTGDTALRALQSKLAKLHREGGTLKYTTTAAVSGVFDVLVQDGFEPQFDHLYLLGGVATVQFSLTCGPYIRTAEVAVTLSSAVTAGGWHVYTAASVPGDVDALGRLVVTDASAADQWHVYWGEENDASYTFTGTAGSGSLVYEAETRTALGGAAIASLASASGGGANNTVLQGALSPTYQAMLSTQASGGGAHLSHVGVFNVFARVYMPFSNTGAVSIAFEYAAGDFRTRTMTTPVTFAADHLRESQFVIVELGQVTIRSAGTGTHRWEGRIVAKSTVTGDDLYVDCLAFVPTRASGRASAVLQFETATSFSARDEFDQTAGALVGKTLPAGGTWGGHGDADDFAVETTGKTAQRATTVDTVARVAIAGTTASTLVTVQADVKVSAALAAGAPRVGVAARIVDATNYAAAHIERATVGGVLRDRIVMLRVIGGATTGSSTPLPFTVAAGVFYTLRVQIDTAGRYVVWFFRTGGRAGAPVLIGQHTDFATGGPFASGKSGLLDENLTATAYTRNFDNFAAFVPTTDAAIFASQSLEIRHDRVIRKDSTGTYWNRVSSNPGDYLKVPPAGQEARTARIIVKGCRNDPDTLEDTASDSLTTTLNVIPRYLVVPT